MSWRRPWIFRIQWGTPFPQFLKAGVGDLLVPGSSPLLSNLLWTEMLATVPSCPLYKKERSRPPERLNDVPVSTQGVLGSQVLPQRCSRLLSRPQSQGLLFRGVLCFSQSAVNRVYAEKTQSLPVRAPSLTIACSLPLETGRGKVLCSLLPDINPFDTCRV